MKNENDYIIRLEKIKQMLKPIKDIPFNLVIEAMTGRKVIPFDLNDSINKEVLTLLRKSAIKAGKEVNKNGILRKRPNEVGNDIEFFVREALNSFGLSAVVPATPNRRKKTTGYPDILFWYNELPFYLECKTYNLENIATTMRSFYFSPSKEFKVIYDAPHLVISFEIHVAGELDNQYIYKCKHYKILSIEKLFLDVKYEFNSDNKRLYSCENGTTLLDEREIDWKY